MLNTNIKLKMMYIMQALLEKTDENHFLSVNDLIAELEKYNIKSERKSIYSDINLLQDFGVEIECVKERSNQYHVVGRTFELPELKLLVDAVQASRFITESKSRQLIKKLETQCSKYEAKELNRHVFMRNRIKNMNESIYYNIDRIHNALIENKQIKFKYFEYNLNKKMIPKRNGELYIASPYALTWADENYYLIAYYERHQKVCHFRVDRMLDIEVLDEQVHDLEQKNKFDIADYANKHFNMFTGDVERVELLFDNSLINAVMDRFGREVTIFKVDEEHFKIITNLATGPTFLSWLFMFGDKVKILGPDKVKEAMKEHIDSVASLY